MRSCLLGLLVLKKFPLYNDVDINLSNIPDYLIQPKVSKKLFSDVNVLDYVVPDELIAMMVETIDYDNCKYPVSDKESQLRKLILKKILVDRKIAMNKDITY